MSASNNVSPQELENWLLRRFDGLSAIQSWGELSFFYNPGGEFARGAYFATLKFHDGPNDRASRLDREGIFRFNFGIPRAEFQSRFGQPPARPAKGGTVEGPWDFTALDTFTPHPIYGWMSWVCVLNPSTDTMSALEPLIEMAPHKSRKTLEKRKKT